MIYLPRGVLDMKNNLSSWRGPVLVTSSWQSRLEGDIIQHVRRGINWTLASKYGQIITLIVKLPKLMHEKGIKFPTTYICTLYSLPPQCEKCQFVHIQVHDLIYKRVDGILL